MPKLLICAPCHQKGKIKESVGLVLVSVCKAHQHLAEEPIKRKYTKRNKMKHFADVKRRGKRRTMSKSKDALLDLATKGAEFVKKHPEGTQTRHLMKEVWSSVPKWKATQVVRVMKKEHLVRVKGRKLFPLAG